MDSNEFSGGIPSRISGLIFALFRHLLALGELAAEETRILIRQSITAILLLIALILTVVISYLSLLAAIISLLISTTGGGWGLPAAFGAAMLFHLILTVFILFFLRTRTMPQPYEATASELRRDLDSLARYSGKSSHTPQ